MSICPFCGENLALREAFERDGWRFEADGDVYWMGRAVRMPPVHQNILAALARVAPRIMRRDTLLNHIGSEGSHNLISVYLCNIRENLGRQGIENPITNVRGKGLRWGAALPPDEEGAAMIIDAEVRGFAKALAGRLYGTRWERATPVLQEYLIQTAKAELGFNGKEVEA